MAPGGRVIYLAPGLTSSICDLLEMLLLGIVMSTSLEEYAYARPPLEVPAIPMLISLDMVRHKLLDSLAKARRLEVPAILAVAVLGPPIVTSLVSAPVTLSYIRVLPLATPD